MSNLVGLCILLVAVLFVSGLILLGRCLRSARDRAAAAESRARSYLAILEALARRVGGSGRPRPPRELLQEVALQENLSGRDLEDLAARVETASFPAPAGPDRLSHEPVERNTPSPPKRDSGTLADSRYLFVSFEEEIRRARQQGIPLTVLSLNLGDQSAKLSSDRALGDRLLRGVAHAVRGQMRGCDTCIRHSEDEFILILPGVSTGEARRVEERLRLAIRGVSFETRPGRVIRVRANLGSATFPSDAGTFDQLLTMAEVRRLQDSDPAASDRSEAGNHSLRSLSQRPISRN